MIAPTFTTHALERFAERFPGVDLDLEWASALLSSGRVGKSRRRQIRRQCPAHAHEVTQSFRRYYYRLGRSGCVFVVTPPHLVVTVFPLQAAGGQEGRNRICVESFGAHPKTV